MQMSPTLRMSALVTPHSNSITATPLEASLFKEDINPYLRSCSTKELAEKLRDLMEIYCQNLLHV